MRYGRLTVDGSAMLRFTLQADGGPGGLGSRGGLGTGGTADGLASLGATTWEPPSRGVALGADGFETGPYDEATVRSAMKRVVPRWADCYEPYRRKDPYAEGLVVLEVLVEADGTADSARPAKRPAFATTSFTFCALGALTRSEFPPSPTGAAVEVTIPVEFENR